MKLKRHGTKTITVIVPMHDEVARRTLKSILEQAGIELEDFFKSSIIILKPFLKS